MPMNIPSAIDVLALYEELGGAGELIAFSDFEQRLNLYVHNLAKAARKPAGRIRPAKVFTALNEMSTIQRKYFFRAGPWAEIPEGLRRGLTTMRSCPVAVCSYAEEARIVTAWWPEVFMPPRKRKDTVRSWTTIMDPTAHAILDAASEALETARNVPVEDVTEAFVRSLRSRKNSGHRLLGFDELFRASAFIPAETRAKAAAEFGHEAGADGVMASRDRELTFVLRSDPWQRFLGNLKPEGAWKVGFNPGGGPDGTGVAVFHDGQRLVAGAVENVARSE